jgi:phage portal protein BeeE
LSIATENYGASFFANGATPSGVLEHSNSIGSPTKLKETWDKIYKGVIPPDQAQFLETRKFQLNEIARIFRVPPHLIGDLEKSTFSNIEQQSLDFVRNTLNPWVTRWEQCMKRCLILPSEKSRYSIRFNLDGLLRGDYETRMKGYAVGIQNGFMSPNDCRRLENFNLIPAERGGDRYMVNGNMIDISDVGKQWGGASE